VLRTLDNSGLKDILWQKSGDSATAYLTRLNGDWVLPYFELSLLGHSKPWVAHLFMGTQQDILDIKKIL